MWLCHRKKNSCQARGLVNLLHYLLSRLFWCLVTWNRKVLSENKVLLLSPENPLHEPLVPEVVDYTAKKRLTNPTLFLLSCMTSDSLNNTADGKSPAALGRQSHRLKQNHASCLIVNCCQLNTALAEIQP